MSFSSKIKKVNELIRALVANCIDEIKRKGVAIDNDVKLSDIPYYISKISCSVTDVTNFIFDFTTRKISFANNAVYGFCKSLNSLFSFNFDIIDVYDFKDDFTTSFMSSYITIENLVVNNTDYSGVFNKDFKFINIDAYKSNNAYLVPVAYYNGNTLMGTKWSLFPLDYNISDNFGRINESNNVYNGDTPIAYTYNYNTFNIVLDSGYTDWYYNNGGSSVNDVHIILDYIVPKNPRGRILVNGLVRYPDANGLYYLINESLTGDDRIWKHENYNYYITKTTRYDVEYDYDERYWFIGTNATRVESIWDGYAIWGEYDIVFNYLVNSPDPWTGTWYGENNNIVVQYFPPDE